MLRMGKNPEEKSQSQPDVDYANRGYSPYQNNEAYRPTPDASSNPKALTESETIAREIKEKAHEQGISVKRLEGFEQAKWVLVDLGDVVVHIFHKDERGYYNLERLWGDAPFVSSEELQL